MTSPARNTPRAAIGTSLRRFWFPALVLLPAACSPVFLPPEPNAALLARSQSSPDLVRRGHAIHQEKCAKCHAFVDPSAYDREELTRTIIPEMGEKSKLSQADQQAVLAYLLAVSKH